MQKKFNLNGYIFGALRRIWRWFPERKEALKRAAGTGKDWYRCADCGNFAYIKDVQIDHKDPVMPVKGFDSWDKYIGRLFCSAGSLQVLCKPCHKQKSTTENTERRKYKGTKNGSKSNRTGKKV